MSNFVKKDSVVKMSSGEKSKEKCNYFEGFLKNTFVAFLYIVNNSLDHPSIIGIVAFFIDTAVFYKNGILAVKNKKNFRCSNGKGQCIPLVWKCDNHPDCSDASDEVNCDRSVIGLKGKCESSFRAKSNLKTVLKTVQCLNEYLFGPNRISNIIRRSKIDRIK